MLATAIESFEDAEKIDIGPYFNFIAAHSDKISKYFFEDGYSRKKQEELRQDFTNLASVTFKYLSDE